MGTHRPQDISITIDGELGLRPGEVALIYQSDPFPGGHTFEMTIDRGAIRKSVWRWAKFESVVSPEEHTARGWFFWLSSILADHPDFASAKSMPFVLNNIHELRLTPHGIVLKGDCSPKFIRKTK